MGDEEVILFGEGIVEGTLNLYIHFTVMYFFIFFVDLYGACTFRFLFVWLSSEGGRYHG